MKIYKKTSTTSTEFKKWFGDWEDPKAFTSRRKEPSSFAIDEDGKPKVFFHGTRENFSEFEAGSPGFNSNVFGSWQTNRHGIFFTPDPSHANAFTVQGGEAQGGNIMPVYLDMKSPLDFRSWIGDDTLDEFEKEGINPRWLLRFSGFHLDGEDGKNFVEAAKRLGYDGIIFYDENPETNETMESWVVFDPYQIKSAIGNAGTFSPENKSITANSKV